mgnify:CR=1 FL=1
MSTRNSTFGAAPAILFDLFFEVLMAGKVHAAFLALFLEHGAVGHLPFYVADENPLPFCTQAPLGGMA